MPGSEIAVVLEVGKKRTFASAIEWPGWARSGRNEAEALEALLQYTARYRRVVNPRGLGFRAPSGPHNVTITERTPGNATTDFGAPGVSAGVDALPVDTTELKRLVTVLDACWDALTGAIETAGGKELRKGPRGGGRSVAQIAGHVIDAHKSYLRQIYWRGPHPEYAEAAKAIAALKQIDVTALAFASSGEMPETGPRGGALWQPRYFVRRAAWHVLDHAWEIEDRLES